MSGKLRIYKEKLDGYKKFYGLVKTIKMVTLAKYRQTMPRVKTRDASLRYTDKAFAAPFDEVQVKANAKGTLLYVPITTNRGSCGALNSNMIKYIDDVIGANTKLMPIGKKGGDAIVRLYPGELVHGIINDMKQPMHFAFASYIFENALTVPNLERMQIIYTRYVSSGIQRMSCFNIPVFEDWLAKLNDAASTENDKERYAFANALLNSEESLVRDFYEFHATLAILNAVNENELSEYAARIVAVEGQLTNIQQLQSSTQQLYNKTRQGSITASLIEIISAMNAMEGNAAKGVKKDKFWDAAARI